MNTAHVGPHYQSHTRNPSRGDVHHHLRQNLERPTVQDQTSMEGKRKGWVGDTLPFSSSDTLSSTPNLTMDGMTMSQEMTRRTRTTTEKRTAWHGSSLSRVSPWGGEGRSRPSHYCFLRASSLPLKAKQTFVPQRCSRCCDAGLVLRLQAAPARWRHASSAITPQRLHTPSLAARGPSMACRCCCRRSQVGESLAPVGLVSFDARARPSVPWQRRPAQEDGGG